MNKKSTYQIVFVFVSLFFITVMDSQAQSLVFCGAKENDLFQLLQQEGLQVLRFDSTEEAIQQAETGAGIILSARGYPHRKTAFNERQYQMAKKKKLRIYIEYPQYIPGLDIPEEAATGKLERCVVSSSFFGKKLPEMSLLGINDCRFYPVKNDHALLSFAKVAGFNKADFGLSDTKVYPLLFQKENMMIAMTCLSNFKTGRFEPTGNWKIVWENLLSWLTHKKNISLVNWSSDPHPTYNAIVPLPDDARNVAIQRGSEWFFNARLLVHPAWIKRISIYDVNPFPFGPPIDSDQPVGNGSFGILEGHASNISYDGKQQYRYWLRADVQGEVSFSLAVAGKYLNNEKYKHVAENLVDYTFYTSPFRAKERNDKNSPVYGVLGWTHTSLHGLYSDDNARAILGLIGASACLENERWNNFIAENILANFRLSSRQGFQGRYLNQNDIIKNGWKHYFDRDLIYVHPHFESWMWACYIWLYDKTGYQPLLTKAKAAIQASMEAYPDGWRWTNGIQQERARMILPLAWLVRVEDTPEHRQWLDMVVNKLLEYQQDNGAIREELGEGPGHCGRTTSNEAYGQYEASLISINGDPVADMLYTNNFAFFALNEAAQATGNIYYKNAVNKMSEFLTRIQIKSDNHPDLDGGWFRAFDYNNWEYWASNADNGWGAWCTLSGWIQSWIVSTQTLIESNQSHWSITKKMQMKEALKESLWMLDESK